MNWSLPILSVSQFFFQHSTNSAGMKCFATRANPHEIPRTEAIINSQYEDAMINKPLQGMAPTECLPSA